ncbi:hypothetical protein DL93DRAFT_2088418 [Clavulina sp. PMI_390]|nr:hypothetical protein DL93DRAFT_2088418 [Clavulina sp. PMI_390]
MILAKFLVCFQAAADVMLAAASTVEMRRQHTGYSSTDSMLNRLAVYGVATGGVTATVVMAELFMTFVAHHYEGFTLIVLVWHYHERCKLDLIYFSAPRQSVHHDFPGKVRI